MATEPGEPLPLPVAYCAPGHEAAATLALALLGEPVMEVREHPWLGQGDGILLCAPPGEMLLGEVPAELPPWDEVLPKCGICQGILPYHGPFCLVSSFSFPSSPAITGLGS